MFLHIPIKEWRSALLFRTRAVADAFIAWMSEQGRDMRMIRISQVSTAADVVDFCEAAKSRGYNHILLDAKPDCPAPEPLSVDALISAFKLNPEADVSDRAS